jgi:hypothetical protein
MDSVFERINAMKKRLFLFLILTALAIGLAAPARAASADGANRVDFTASVVTDCSLNPSFCSFGEQQTLPNGKTFIIGWKLINVFTATDPRWNADCYFEGDPFPPGGGAFPVSGSFTCYPRDPKYADGWWVGSVNQVYQSDKMLALWHAKGYGTLDHLLVTVYQMNSHWYSDVPPGMTEVGVITELPGYVEP